MAATLSKNNFFMIVSFVIIINVIKPTGGFDELHSVQQSIMGKQNFFGFCKILDFKPVYDEAKVPCVPFSFRM